MTVEPGVPFGDQLARFGSVNFSQDCVVGGRQARVAMTPDRTILAVDDGTVHDARFANVRLAGEGTIRSVTLGGDANEVEFGSEDEANRLFLPEVGV